MAEESKARFQCIFVLIGMYRNIVEADSIQDLYTRLSGTSVVEKADLSTMTDQQILDSIYSQSVKTTGRLTVYKLNENYDPDNLEDFEDNEYVVCKTL